jgi:hypothetical protein
VCDLLGAVLVDDVVVRHGHGVREAEVDLLLAGPGFALGRLHPDAGALHAVANLADERLVVGRREDVIVEDVGDGRRQVAVVLGVRLLVGLLQEIELELGPDHRFVSELRGSLDLLLQDLPRGRLDRRSVVPDDVAEDERRGVEPRNPAERRHVGPEPEVPVTLLPARDRVAGHGIHLHLERE